MNSNCVFLWRRSLIESRLFFRADSSGAFANNGQANNDAIPKKSPVICPSHDVLPNESILSPTLTHLDASGHASMVDVTPKPATVRFAEAVARVTMPGVVTAQIRRRSVAKGDVLAVARVAGIMGAKRTSDLIPLCHNIPLSDVKINLEIDDDEVTSTIHSSPRRSFVDITATASAEAKTGVEMEALTAALTAALTIYDMCKGMSRDIVIEEVRLVKKTGGKEDYERRKDER